MLFHSTRLRAGGLALAVPCLLAVPVSAQQKAATGDLREISAYTFTMPKFKRLMTAMLNLGKAVQADSSMVVKLDDMSNLSVDQSVARYAAVPAAKRAIADAGLTPREYVVAQGAMLQAGMSYAIMKQYKLTADSVSKTTGVSKANLEFFRANEAEIERIGKEMEALAPKDRPSNDGADANADAEAGDTIE